MEFDYAWLLMAFPLAFALGWLASRLDLRQLRVENRQAPKAYFRGLNFLLNEQQDQAIDAFIEAVQNDPDTSELHFALGNLFRRRGEYERAVRVHEHLMSRGDLSHADHNRAQHALALDFLKAGLLDRAEVALRKHKKMHNSHLVFSCLEPGCGYRASKTNHMVNTRASRNFNS
jgi:lipopolysaccharide biosynthesis regulator YciM